MSTNTAANPEQEIAELKAELESTKKLLLEASRCLDRCEELTYEPMNGPAPIEFHFHANPDEFCYSERTSFKDSLRLSESQIIAWGESAVWRAVGKDSRNRMGYRRVQERSSKPSVEVFDNLPAFGKDLFMEVTVRIVRRNGNQG